MYLEKIRNLIVVGVLLAFVTSLLSGCASTDTYFRSEYPYFVAAQRSGDVIGKPYNLMTLYCVDANEKIEYLEDKNGEVKPSYKHTQCTYVSANTNTLISDPTMGLSSSPTDSNDEYKERRDIITSILMNISDQNCDTFLNRAFANKAVTNYTANLLRDLSTSGSAAFAYGSPGVSVGLNVANLLVGTATKDFDKQFYVDQTFRAMRKAIEKKREKIRNSINTAQAQDNYTDFTMAAALSKLREYASACSIQAGIAELEELASQPTATR